MGSVTKTLDMFTEDLRLGRVKGFFTIVCATVDFLKGIVDSKDWKTAAELIKEIKRCGRIMVRAMPTEAGIGNMVRRVLKIVRDEYVTAQIGSHFEAEESLHGMLLSSDEEVTLRGYEIEFPGLHESILDGISELMAEMDTGRGNVVSQAAQHILSEEVIMTVGFSHTVEEFLKAASKKRSFQVVVVEVAPSCLGQQHAKRLAEAGIRTTLIPDSAVFAVMSRINKVVVGAHCVMANGGLKADCGMHSIALAAKRYSVPVIVCCVMTKLSPLFLCSYDQDAFNKFNCAEEVADFAEDLRAQVYAPTYDYVPPDLVSLFVSNIGGNAPSYVYRLLSEFYHPNDYEI